MNELEQLKSMWAHKVKRLTKLIVPDVTYINGKGSLNNAHWKFVVPYAFRDALDLKYEKRMKNKEPHMVWTQGVILRFKDGDTISSRCGTSLVQVKYANPMGWDVSKDEMYEGSVLYEEFGHTEECNQSLGERNITQMKFLELLIYGEIDC